MTTDRVFLRDLRLQGILGVFESERTHPQEILVNIIMHVDTRPAALSDKLEDAVDYLLTDSAPRCSFVAESTDSAS